MKGLQTLYPLLLLSTASFAATEFEGDVPAEVIEQVMGAIFGQQVQIYSDLPDGFPPFELPRNMQLLVSVDQVYMQRVILKSEFDPQAATALAYGALLDAGWELIPLPGAQLQQTGFINQFQPPPQTQLCHDEHGMMQVSAQIGSGATYVNLTRSITPQGMPAPVCAPPPQVDPQMPEPYRLMQEQMPRLLLPAAGGMSSSGGYGGGGGGPNEWEARANVNGPWELERVYDYFVEQIVMQGWEGDASVVGDNMATGSWTKTVEDAELVGTLTVLLTGENTYDLRFRLIRKGAPGNFGVLQMGRDAVLRAPLPAPSLGIRGIPAGIRIVPQGAAGNAAVIVTE